MKTKFFKIGYLFVFLCVVGVFADDDLESVYIGESVISDSQINDDTIQSYLNYQQELPSKTVSIINKNKLLESGSGTGGVLSVLENVPGATYDRSNGLGGTLVMRGMSTRNDRTIVAIDGVKIEGRPVLEFHLIDPNSIDAIEVIRGAASSMYGSNAMNGVINFKTRQWGGNINAPFSLEAKIRAIEYASVNNGVAIRGELLGGGDGFDVLIGVQGRRGDNFRTPEGVVKASNYSTWGVDFNLGYTHSNIRYYTQGRYQRVRSHEASYVYNRPGTAFGLYMAELPLQEIFIKAGLQAYNPGIFADKLEAYIFYNRYDTDIETDTTNLNNNGNGSNGGKRQHIFVYNSSYVGAKVNFDKNIASNAISYGLDIWSVIAATPNRTQDKSTGTITTSSRDNYQIQIAPYIKDDWSILDSLILSAALRYDYLITIIGSKRYTSEDSSISSFLDNNKLTHQGAVTGNLGIVYYINDMFSIVANASNNFKSPGTNGLFPTNNTEPNHNLKPEYAQTYEIGARFHDDNNYASLVAYYTNYINMIQSITLGGGQQWKQQKQICQYWQGLCNGRRV